MKRDLIATATEQGASLLPFSPISGSEEGRLLIEEAKDYMGAPVQDTRNGDPRAESKKRRIRNYTGERLFKEEPQRYRLISGMLLEGVGVASIRRACKCDIRTIRSVERREAEGVSHQKTKLIGTLGRVARMSAERMEEEINKMNHAQLAVTCGIATDKLQALTGGANMRVEVTLAAPGENIFDRINRLHVELTKSVGERMINATAVIEPPALALGNHATNASTVGKETPQKEGV